MKIKILFFLILIILALPIVCLATDRYISPSGSGSTCSSGTPCSFSTARSATTGTDDRIVAKDGTYSSGAWTITCGTNATSGSAGHPMVLTAEHERAAHLVTGGAYPAIDMTGCQYWTVNGFYLEGGDSPGNFYDNFQASDNRFLTITRNVFSKNNRYFNVHLLDFYTHNYDVLVEENEFYNYHRHAIVAKPVIRGTFRRNYCNSRAYTEIGGGYPQGPNTRGGACMSLYPTADAIVENNIAEDGSWLLELNASGEDTATDNRILGNLSVNQQEGIVLQARDNDLLHMPRDTTIADMVIVGPSPLSDGFGVLMRSAKNTIVSHVSVFTEGDTGFLADEQVAPYQGDGNPSTFIDSSLSLDNGGYGYLFADQTFSLVEYSNAYSNTSGAFSVPNSSNTSTNDPEMGTCYAWIPESSPLKAAGKSGTDIGANVLYRYQDGVLSGVPLWDEDGTGTPDGVFPHGATVAGVNDHAGDSLFDVQDRLNINTNGCSFPSSYASSNTPNPKIFKSPVVRSKDAR